MTRRRTFFACLWFVWIGAFVAIESSALAVCEDGMGVGGCTFSALWWRVTQVPAMWGLGVLALVILGVHLASRGRF